MLLVTCQSHDRLSSSVANIEMIDFRSAELAHDFKKSHRSFIFVIGPCWDDPKNLEGLREDFDSLDCICVVSVG
jgi:hypothetical protein